MDHARARRAGRCHGAAVSLAGASLRTAARGLRNAAENNWEDVLDGFWTDKAQDLERSDLSAYRSTDPQSAAGMIAMDLA